MKNKILRMAAALLMMATIFVSAGCSGPLEMPEWLQQELCDHVYDEEEILKEATCTEDGRVKKICSDCGKTKIIIKRAGHTVVEDEAVDATCTTPGLTAGSHCTVCGEVLVKQEEVMPIFGGSVTVDGWNYKTDSLWIRGYDFLQVPGHPNNIYTMAGYFNDVTASEYVVSATTRSSTDKTSPYYSNDNAQGITLLGKGGSTIGIQMWGGGFRLFTNGATVRTDGLGKGFLNDMKGNSYVDIVQTVVRRGNALYVFVGEKGADLQLYLIISPEQGIVPVGDNHVIHASYIDAVSTFTAGLGNILGDGVLNGFGYRITMNMSIDTNFNNSMIYDLGYDLTASGIDAMLTNAIIEDYDTAKGTVAYSGEGYVASGKKYVAGKPITITVSPKDGYSMASLTVNGKAITDYTVGANGDVSYTDIFGGAITVEVVFNEDVFMATANLTRVQYLSTVSIVATSSDDTTTIEAVFEKSTSDNSIVIELPVGTWTLTFKNSSGDAVATGTVTILGQTDEDLEVTILNDQE